MPIDRSARWWRGADFADLAEYLRIETAEAYPADTVVRAACACGGGVFALDYDPAEGCARRACPACGAEHFVCDSGEYWEEAEPEACVCPCGGRLFEIGVAFSRMNDGEVRWITGGVRCAGCGVLGAPVDWKVDYTPSGQLLEAV
jgi:hypothetical protein